MTLSSGHAEKVGRDAGIWGDLKAAGVVACAIKQPIVFMATKAHISQASLQGCVHLSCVPSAHAAQDMISVPVADHRL